LLSIGIDIGGTKILGAIVDDNGKVISEKRVSSPAHDPELMVNEVASLILELSAQAALEMVPVGVAAAGFIDADQANVLYAPNLSWRDEPLRERLEEKIQRSLVIENDANAAGWAEYRFGAGMGSKDMVMLTLGTGVGGAVISDGAIRRGGFGIAGELGHIRVVRGGKQCGCGRKGCVGVPLMRQGADQRRFCVACDKYEDEALDEAVEEAGEEDWRRFVQDEEKQSAEDPLAKPVSEHLLKGYVLLGKQCPVSSCPSPLMRAPDGSEVCVQPACVAAAMMDDDDDDDDLPAARNEDQSWLPPPVPGAAALGAHLIRGWGMMEDICANRGCNSPLMRSPAGVVGCVQPECGGAGDGTAKRAAAAPQHQAKRAVPTSRHRPPPAFLAARFAPEPADDVFGAAAAACLGTLRDQARGLAAVRAGEVAAAAGALGACARALASMHGDARAAAAEARAAVRERVGEATAALGAASGFGETRAAAEALEALAVADRALSALL